MPYTYLLETNDSLELDVIQAMARHLSNTTLTPIMVEDSEEYPGEKRYATEDILSVLYDTVKDSIWDECTEEPDFVPLELMPGADRWKLMRMGVQEWGHLGGNGASADQIAGAWRDGRLDFIFASKD